MNYTEELLAKADAVIPRVTLEDFHNDSHPKVMIDVRQHEELQASGTVEGSIHIPTVSYTHLTLPTKRIV